MEEEKEDDWRDQFSEPEVSEFTLTDLVRWIAYLFAFAIYVFIFLKILVLS